MRQARLALLAAGLLATVEAGVAQMDQAAQIEWQYADTVTRTSALMLTLGAALGLNDEALDGLFTSAALL